MGIKTWEANEKLAKPPPKYSDPSKKAVMKYFFDIYFIEKVVFHHLEPVGL